MNQQEDRDRTTRSAIALSRRCALHGAMRLNDQLGQVLACRTSASNLPVD